MTPQQAKTMLDVLQSMTRPQVLQPFMDAAYSSEEAVREARIQARMHGADDVGDVEAAKYEFAGLRQSMPSTIGDYIARALAGEYGFVDLDYTPQEAFTALCRQRGVPVSSADGVIQILDDGRMGVNVADLQALAQQYRPGLRAV